MQVQQNIADFQEKFVIKLDPKIAKIVSPADRRALAAEYLNMFAGFSCVNWTNKYSLGRAWQTALTQCGAFVDTKNEKNPAAKYLKNVYASHKQYWSRVIMTHNGRENVINPDDKQIKQYREQGGRMLRAAMDKINLILARYNERTEELIATQAQTQEQKQPMAQAQPRPQPQAAAPQQPAQVAQPAPQQMPSQQSLQQQPMAQAQPQVAHQQNMEKWVNGVRAVGQLQLPASQQAEKSVARPAMQSGAFAMTRDVVRRPNAAITKENADVRIPQVQPEQMAKHVAQQSKQPAVVDQAQELTQPIVHHAAKSVTAPVAKSGALPMVRNEIKQPNVVKSVEKPQQAPIIKLNPQTPIQQLNFQRQLQIWQLGQFKQNAA